MTNKVWYVYTDSKLTDHENKGVVQYFRQKKDAEKLLKKLLRMRPPMRPPFKSSYIDFNWKEDIKNNITVKELHGKHIIKVDSILDYLAG
jgi:hypothetical protein